MTNPAISAVILDIQDFNVASDNLFGTELFRPLCVRRCIARVGNADELPQSTVQNNQPIPATSDVERVFPGNHDIVHGQFILRPEGKDIDLYRFAIHTRVGQRSTLRSLLNDKPIQACWSSNPSFRNNGTAAAPMGLRLPSTMTTSAKISDIAGLRRRRRLYRRRERERQYSTILRSKTQASAVNRKANTSSESIIVHPPHRTW